MVAPIPDEDLLGDIKRVHQLVGHAPSENDYREHGEYSVSAARRAFGTYTAAREAAGVPEVDRRGGHNKLSRDELVSALRDLHNRLDRVPTQEEMNDVGRYSESAYRTEFGSWNDALRAVGFDENHRFDVEREEYECANCGAAQKRLPSQIKNQNQVFCSQRCQGEFSSGERHAQYDRVTVSCETCGVLLKRKPAVAADRERHFCDRSCYGDWCSSERTGERHPRWKGGGELYYGPNWQSQRRLRLAEDDYNCFACGQTDASHRDEFGRELSVHHRRPVRSFYHETENDEPDWEEVNALSNLLTLCLPCHRTWESIPVQIDTR
jgi:5-methylcytosine-specific restriction endonuclease McrA